MAASARKDISMPYQQALALSLGPGTATRNWRAGCTHRLRRSAITSVILARLEVRTWTEAATAALRPGIAAERK
jgi:hypothetical protein